jgi:hypothetical protein
VPALATVAALSVLNMAAIEPFVTGLMFDRYAIEVRRGGLASSQAFFSAAFGVKRGRTRRTAQITLQTQ